MALRFLTSSEFTIAVVITCDPAVTCTDEQRKRYLETGEITELTINGDATEFVLKALGPEEREHAEMKAGAFTRSELGRILWLEEPAVTKERGYWHEALSEQEKHALSSYKAYINKVHIEMIRASLVSIDGEPASIDDVQGIRPEDHRISVLSELGTHITRISLLGHEGK